MGSVIRLKKQINNSYFQLKNSVDNKLMLVEEKIKLKLDSNVELVKKMTCLLYTSPSPRDTERSRMPSSA